MIFCHNLCVSEALVVKYTSGTLEIVKTRPNFPLSITHYSPVNSNVFISQSAESAEYAEGYDNLWTIWDKTFW